ncbi:MAG: hypothetical protein AAB036_07600 [Elusimicrobiota bacterium]
MGLIIAVCGAALKRPWLLAPLLAGVFVRFLLDALFALGPSVSSPVIMLNTVASILSTVAVTAIFCELWLGDGRHLKGDRLLSACLLFLLPYPLQLLVAMVSAPVVYVLLGSGLESRVLMPLILLQAAAGKLVAYVLAAASALGAAHRDEHPGVLAAWRHGWSLVRGNAGFFAATLGATLLLQETSAYFLRATVLADVFSTIVPLIGCVAVTLEAGRSARLKAP